MPEAMLWITDFSQQSDEALWWAAALSLYVPLIAMKPSCVYPKREHLFIGQIHQICDERHKVRVNRLHYYPSEVRFNCKTTINSHGHAWWRQWKKSCTVKMQDTWLHSMGLLHGKSWIAWVSHGSVTCNVWPGLQRSGRILARGYLLTRTFCKITKDNKFFIVASTAFIRCQH